MNWLAGTTSVPIVALVVTLAGCMLRDSSVVFDGDIAGYQALANSAEHPDVHAAMQVDESQLIEPLTTANPEREPWLLTPEMAVQIAIERSSILKDLGGTFLQASENFRTIHDPAIQTTDPRFGVEAALSAFDAQFTTRGIVEKNNFAVNNRFLGGGANVIDQDLFNFESEVTKKTASGTNLFFRNKTDYDANNAPGNLFPSAWNTMYEAGFRQHLGRGGGVEFNRIAGPDAVPGVYNGVMIARVNADASIVDFEIALRDLISDVENAYWDLYFAYRQLHARIAARDAALNTWREVEALRRQQNVSADKEAQAREQYFRFQAEVHDALSGRLVDGTRVDSGSSGGTFRGTMGVHVAERRLRFLMNLPVNDGRMIRPAHDPIIANVIFSWPEIAGEALGRRAELRKQELLVRRRQMELIASKNFLLPEIDALARYRARGFGRDLLAVDRAGRDQFDNAFMNLTSGDFQEWQFGLEVTLPVGFRRAHAGVRNAQLSLARERDILAKKEQRVLHDLSNAYADLQRAYELCRINFDRRLAAREQSQALRALEQQGAPVDLNLLLDAQNREADADMQFFAAQVQYMLALKNLHYEKGTLMEYNNVLLADRANPVAGRYQISQPNSEIPTIDFTLAKLFASGPRTNDEPDSESDVESDTDRVADDNSPHHAQLDGSRVDDSLQEVPRSPQWNDPSAEAASGNGSVIGVDRPGISPANFVAPAERPEAANRPVPAAYHPPPLRRLPAIEPP